MRIAVLALLAVLAAPGCALLRPFPDPTWERPVTSPSPLGTAVRPATPEVVLIPRFRDAGPEAPAASPAPAGPVAVGSGEEFLPPIPDPRDGHHGGFATSRELLLGLR